MTRLPRSLASAVLALALVLSPLGASVASAANLTFADEFNAGPLNTNVWKTVLPWGTQYNNHEQQWYDPANLSFVNSGLRITTKQGYDNGYPYSSGIVTSKSQMSYGYFEFRAKLPKGPGIWPALWLLNDGTQEIDVMELLGNTPNKVYMTYHRNGQQYQSTYTLPSGDFSQAYHTFAVDVQPSYIHWYVDGVQRGSYTASIPSNTGNIIVNTAVGDSTSWPGAPTSATTFPQYLDLDYVHVYPTMADAAAPSTPPAPANSAPVASADSYSVNQDTALSVAAPGVLANDTDADGNVLTASLAAQPAHGTVALSSNGSFIYTPAVGYTGPDTFSYTASDGSLSSAVTAVNITVKSTAPTNLPPVGVPDAYAMDAGTTLSVPAPGVLANDSDPNGDAIYAFLAVWPTHGTATMARDGSFTYTPNPGFIGTETFTYRATDDVLNSPVTTVTVMVRPVNHAPVATTDSYATNQDTTLTVAAPGVLVNDADMDGNPLTAAVATQPGHGALTLAADGSLVYVPAAGWSGTDSFTYTASDGSLSSQPATVSIAVAPVVVTPPPTDPGTVTPPPADPGTATPPPTDPGTATPPPADPGTITPPPADPGTVTPPADTAPVASDDVFSMRENRVLAVKAPGVLRNDVDVDGQRLTATLDTQPAHGTVTLAADGSFTYRPAATFSGADTFTYRASDGSGTSTLAKVTINVKTRRTVQRTATYRSLSPASLTSAVLTVRRGTRTGFYRIWSFLVLHVRRFQ